MIPLTRALALVLLTAVAMGYGWHRTCVENRRLTKDRDTFAEDAEMQTLLADATKEATERAFAKVTADFNAHVDALNADLADTKRMLRAEQGYSALCDRQLEKLAAVTEGKTLFPSLVQDDALVIEFPTRGAR